VAVVGDFGVEPQDLGLAVGEVELDRQRDLFDFGQESAASRRVEQLRQLLLERGAALVRLAGDLSLDDAADGEDVDTRLAIEAVVLGGDQGTGEVRRDRRARVSDATGDGLRPRELGGLAR
jgi:hypothetical protein